MSQIEMNKKLINKVFEEDKDISNLNSLNFINLNLTKMLKLKS